MIALSSAAALIGLSDLLRISVSKPFRRILMAITAAALLLAMAVSSPWWASVGAIIACLLWLGTYSTTRQVPLMLGAAAVLIGLAVPAILALSPPRLDLRPPLSPNWRLYEWILTLGAVALVNLATANRVVRVILDFAQRPTTQVIAPAGAPRAGRIIGVLERYLLIILVVGGQSLTIAGLAAAKSIIRYPEISRSAEGKNGLSAEVFFIGTTTSWLFALISAGALVLVAG